MSQKDGIRDKPIAARSPWLNGFAERLIGSIRGECTDHIVALGEGRLRRVLRSYARYYNENENTSILGQRFTTGRARAHARRIPPPACTADWSRWPRNLPALRAWSGNPGQSDAAQCAKATFFAIGKHALWHPEIIKQVAQQGHTIGTHTWSHTALARKSAADAKAEIEKGFSGVRLALGGAPASFFRFPALAHPPEMVTYLGKRNIAMFSTDMDSFDFKTRKPEQVIATVMNKLKQRGKGIVLMHDFQRVTAEAMPELLNQLKVGGFRIVHLKSKAPAQTLPEYDALVLKDQKLPIASDRPTASVVRTISE
jgi:hypothetical protein